MAWGSVDAIPGVDVMRVVVATLDGDATFYGVTAESHGLASDATRTGGGDDGMMRRRRHDPMTTVMIR